MVADYSVSVVPSTLDAFATNVVATVTTDESNRMYYYQDKVCLKSGEYVHVWRTPYGCVRMPMSYAHALSLSLSRSQVHTDCVFHTEPLSKKWCFETLNLVANLMIAFKYTERLGKRKKATLIHTHIKRNI